MKTCACILLPVALTLSACGDTSGPGGNQADLRLTLRAGTGASAAASADTITAGGDVLVLDQVELVLREIELELIGDDDDCPTASGSDDDCGEIELGPMLLDLPLGPDPARSILVSIPAGSYDEIEFELHKPDDDTDRDRQFLAQHPDFRKVSIRARGRFNGRPFTWVTDQNEEQEIDLVPPLTVAEGGEVELTLTVDVASWFRAGGRLIDPARAGKGGPDENQVKDNVRRSFRVFERDDDD